MSNLSTSSRSLNSSTLQTHRLAVASKTSTNAGTFLTKDSCNNKKQCNKICCTGPIFPQGKPVKSRDKCDPNDI